MLGSDHDRHREREAINYCFGSDRALKELRLGPHRGSPVRPTEMYRAAATTHQRARLRGCEGVLGHRTVPCAAHGLQAERTLWPAHRSPFPSRPGLTSELSSLWVVCGKSSQCWNSFAPPRLARRRQIRRRQVRDSTCVCLREAMLYQVMPRNAVNTRCAARNWPQRPARLNRERCFSSCQKTGRNLQFNNRTPLPQYR